MKKQIFLKFKLSTKFFFYICKNNYLVVYDQFSYTIVKIFSKILINNFFLFLYLYNKKKLLNYKRLFKKLLNYTTKLYKKKIYIIGLGFRVNQIFFNNFFYLLQLKLGYSHQIYLKIPFELKITIFKHVKLFIESVNLLLLNQFCSFIKNLKKFNAYKKKGIFFFIKSYKLKKNKKI
uniref:Ribosomal protein L6 n=1 Tax=Melosira undulata TaxID=2133757 RepID=A0A3G1PWG0_9STRA|nr:ribosomal protein L6 [Melosira undulata]AVR57569.1 ribosomal protein L6 [Melosira undulata]